jgi:hypothetical protein
MLNPIITPPRVPLVDANTGLINRSWYLFFVSLNNIANDVVNDPVVGPSPESLVASYDALLQTLTQEIETQPSTSELVAQTAELQKQVDALQSQIVCPCAELTAELQKQIEGLQLTPAVEPVSTQTTGISGTAALAKLTALGTDGSLTFVNGLITAYVAPT